MKKYLVMKFGGKCLENLDLVKAVADYLKVYLAKHPDTTLVVVVSAMGKFTDKIEIDLKELAPNFYTKKDKSPGFAREVDSAMQAGEVISASYLTARLQEIGISAISLNAFQLQISTVGGHQNARIKEIEGISRLIEESKSHDVIVVTGFQGMHENEIDAIATLGRGGSDTAAVALAAKLGRCKCIFFKASGIITAFDPSISEDAKALNFITYADARTLSEYGYQFLHPRCLEIAQRFSVALEFKASPGLGHDPNQPGTTIGERLDFIENLSGHFQAIALKPGIMFVTVNNVPNEPGWSEKIFGLCQRYQVMDFQQVLVDDGAKSVINFIISNMNDAKNWSGFKTECEKLHSGIHVQIWPELGCLTFIDSEMQDGSGFGHIIGKILAKGSINIVGQITSGNKIHTFIPENEMKAGALAIATAFGLFRHGS